ncbi:putative outer membrane spanin component [Caulobacter phage Ccr5]|nr:putative outer membrane spanin component [Caulobacter phage Ccr5]
MPRLAKSSTRSSTSSRVIKAVLLPSLVMLSLTLAACQTVPVGFSPDDLYPKELRTCAPAPQVPPRPAPGAPRPEDVQAGYVKDDHLAGADCRDKVESWNERAVKYEAQYKAMNAGPVGKFFGKLKGKKQ